MWHLLVAFGTLAGGGGWYRLGGANPIGTSGDQAPGSEISSPEGNRKADLREGTIDEETESLEPHPGEEGGRGLGPGGQAGEEGADDGEPQPREGAEGRGPGDGPEAAEGRRLHRGAGVKGPAPPDGFGGTL